ncbi:MAG: hypothetical protein C5B54_01890 [Acidobacteria bacterium]|nr:MAG: hypothetical protein C5B54_01890 [Acidobacteriota bacterium]
MAFIMRPNRPTTGNTPALAVGDIWIHTNTGAREQLQSMGPDVWTVMPIDPGFVAAGGNPPQRLAKTGTPFGATNWGGAADGIVATHTQATAAAVWNVEHRLVSRLVQVLVVDPSRNDMIMVPDIVYTDTLWCELRFATPVSGIAIIRR